MNVQPNYRIYATLLDAHMQLERAEVIWEKYYGFSQESPCTPEEFREKLERELIDRVNRVPFESEAADRGTAFNELIDALIEKRQPKMMEVERTSDLQYLVNYNGHAFKFPIQLCVDMAVMYKNALTQRRVSGVMRTGYGDVELYGVIDELMPMAIHDIKTTSSYSVGKYKYNNQHLVYPWALRQLGVDLPTFHYDVVEIGKPRKDGTCSFERYQETYTYVHERDESVLRSRVENFIMWLEMHRAEITDKKIFGGGRQHERCRIIQ